MQKRTLAWLTVVSMGSGLAVAEPSSSTPGLVARVVPASRFVSLNHPIWVQFIVENVSNEPLTLTVPGTEPAIPSPEIALPLSHIFSGGPGDTGVVISTDANRSWDQPVGFHSPSQAPVLLLAPHGVVGVTVDLRDYFPALRGAGQFRVVWKPYGAAITSSPAFITIAPRKQVEIETDQGPMTVELFYDDAPLTVENFLELVRTGLYTSKSFHRLEPGYLLQGVHSRSIGRDFQSLIQK